MPKMPECLTRLAAAIVSMRELKMAYSGWKPGIEDDLFFRARILEGAAGLPQWSLAGNPSTFLREGPKQFPDVDEEWFSRKDVGLADAAYYNIQGLIKGEGGLITAEELYQDIITGVGASSKQDLPGAVGRKYADKILSGNMGPRVFKTGIKNIVKRRALDAIKKQRTRDKNLNDPISIGPGLDDDAPDIDPADVVDTLSPMQAIALIMSGPKGRDFLRWAYKLVEAKGSEPQRAVFEAYVEDPDATNKQLAEGLGISPQMAGRHRDNALKLIKDGIAKNPRVLDWVQDALALRGLDDIDAVEMAKLPLRWKGRRASASRVAWMWVRAADREVNDLLRDFHRGEALYELVTEFVGDQIGQVIRNPRLDVEIDDLRSSVDSRGTTATVSGSLFITVKGPKVSSLVREFAKEADRWAREGWEYSPKVTEALLSHREIVKDVWGDYAYESFAESEFTEPLLKKMVGGSDLADHVEDELGGDYDWDGKWYPSRSEVEVDDATYDPKSGEFAIKASFTLSIAVIEDDNWTAEDDRYDQLEQRGRGF